MITDGKVKPDYPSPQVALYRTMHNTNVLYRTGNHGLKTMCYWLHLLKDSDGRPFNPWSGRPISIIEIGCGNGILCNTLSQMELDVTGMDLITADYIYDRSNYKFLEHDLIEIPYDFKDRHFRYCLSFDVLEHISEEHIPEVLKEMARISSNLIIKVACNGTPPLHVTVHNLGWWRDKLNEFCPEFAWQTLGVFYQSHPRTGETLYAPLFYGWRVKDEG